MKISKQARRDAKALFLECRVDGLLDENRVRAVVATAAERKPRGYLAILTHFQRLVRLDIARRTAKVASAAPLDASLRGAIEKNLQARYGAGLTIGYAEEAGLIGGLRVQVGSDVYDGSIQARLAALNSAF